MGKMFECPKFVRVEMKPGSIGEEIQRLMTTKPEVNGKADRKAAAPVMLSGLVVSFVHFVLALIVFSPSFDEMPDIGDVWGVLNGSDVLHGVALRSAISRFLPIWLDMPFDGHECFEAEKITDAWHEFIWSELNKQ